MKLSKLFHWLYASLMFLPLLVIPIFAIYTRNESNNFENNIELQVEQNKVVDFNQLANEPVLVNGGSFTDNVYTSNENASYCGFQYILSNNLSIGTQLYIKFDYQIVDYVASQNLGLAFNYGSYQVNSTCIVDNNINSKQLIVTIDNHQQINNRVIVYSPHSNGTLGSFIIKNIGLQIFNLTQMFGVGNEPSIEQFNVWYPSYYDYTLSEKQLLKNYSIETLNNTDIGSQFLYSVYKPINDYFNIKDWMNLGGLFDWFLLNIFNGSNSIVIPIIFNLIIYWLVVSFIWLIFDVLMYVPNMIHKMLDKARME